MLLPEHRFPGMFIKRRSTVLGFMRVPSLHRSPLRRVKRDHQRKASVMSNDVLNSPFVLLVRSLLYVGSVCVDKVVHWTIVLRATLFIALSHFCVD